MDAATGTPHSAAALRQGKRDKPVSTSLRISLVVLAASLAAGACQSGGPTAEPTAIPTAIPTVMPTATPTQAGRGVFSSTGPVSSNRVWGHTATLLANGKVLIVGGAGDTGGALASAELYDPDTDSFSPTRSMSSVRTEHSATLLPNGKVLFAGGYDPESRVLWASAEVYDPTTGSFSPTGSMSSDTPCPIEGTGTSSIQFSEPRSGCRARHTATLLANGKVLITGGTAAYSSGYLASAELYDPGTGSFSPTGSMPITRYGHTATLLANGKVLIVGGGGDTDGALASVELYDPGTGSFSQTGSMPNPSGGTHRDLAGKQQGPDHRRQGSLGCAGFRGAIRPGHGCV